MKKQSKINLSVLKPKSELFDDFTLYTQLITSGSDRSMIEHVFDDNLSNIKSKFNRLTYKYSFIENLIGEARMNTFIIAKIKQQQVIKEKIIQKLAYPFILLIALFFMMIFFNIYIIPNVMIMTRLFTDNLIELELLSVILNFFIIISLILFKVVIILLFLFYKDKVKSYRFIYHKLNNSLIVKYYSINFAVLYLTLLEQELATLSCFNILSNLEDDKIIAASASWAKKQFENGKDMNDVIIALPYESKLQKFLATGHFTSNSILLLKEYITVSELRFMNMISKKTRNLQLVIYILIGVFVILLYRLLLIPMQLIEL